MDVAADCELLVLGDLVVDESGVFLEVGLCQFDDLEGVALMQLLLITEEIHELDNPTFKKMCTILK